MLAYNNLKEIAQALPICVSAIFILCIFVPLKFKHYAGILMVICAIAVSLCNSIIANNYFDWFVVAIWLLISSVVGWSTYTNYKMFMKIESEYKAIIVNDIYITKLLYEGKYEPYERPACDD